jgi:hypothetical protein
MPRCPSTPKDGPRRGAEHPGGQQQRDHDGRSLNCLLRPAASIPDRAQVSIQRCSVVSNLLC